jgi:hypothetical protein
MLISDLAKDIVWHCHQRYSAFRALHMSVGKHFNTGESFPGILVTSRSNRKKTEITARRERLEKYMRKLVETVFSEGGGEKPLHRVAKLLQFLEHPFEGEFLRSSLSVDNSDVTSTISETVASGQNAKIAVLEQPKFVPAPVIVTSRWKAPGLLPSHDIGLGMPFVTVGQSVTGDWEMLIKGDRQLRKGLLRHRYDEAAAMCAFMSPHHSVMDASEAQDFIVEFRRKHPLAAYLRLEKALECHSPSSANRSDRSSSPNPPSASPPVAASRHHREGDDLEAEEVGSPVVHHRRDSASGSGFGEFGKVDQTQIFTSARAIEDPSSLTGIVGNHYNLRRDYLTVGRSHRPVLPRGALVSEESRDGGISSPRTPPAGRLHAAAAEHLGHHCGLDGSSHSRHGSSSSISSTSPMAASSPAGRGGDLALPPATASPIRRRAPLISQPRPESEAERYLRRVTCERVAGCCCTATAFCTSPGYGDIYMLRCGVALIVCPPPLENADE